MFGHVETAVNDAPRVSSWGGAPYGANHLPKAQAAVASEPGLIERVLPFPMAKFQAGARHPWPAALQGELGSPRGHWSGPSWKLLC